MKVASAPKRTGYFGTRVSDFEQLVVSAKVRITENEEHLADACKPDPAIAAGVTQAAYMYLGKVYVVEKLVPIPSKGVSKGGVGGSPGVPGIHWSYSIMFLRSNNWGSTASHGR